MYVCMYVCVYIYIYTIIYHDHIIYNARIIYIYIYIYILLLHTSYILVLTYTYNLNNDIIIHKSNHRYTKSNQLHIYSYTSYLNYINKIIFNNIVIFTNNMFNKIRQINNYHLFLHT